MQNFEAFNTVMHSWWSVPLGNVRVLLVCFAGIAFSSLKTGELKVASGKPKRKHCSKRISQEQKEKENSKKSRPFEQMPPRRAPVFLLSPGINTRGATLPPCWIYSKSRGFYRPIRHFSPVKVFLRLRVVPHFSSGMVGRAKRERAWKSPHARKGDTRHFSLSPPRVAFFSRGVIFTRACVSLALLSLRKNGGLLVV